MYFQRQQTSRELLLLGQLDGLGSAAFFLRMPCSLLKALAWRIVWKAWNLVMSSVIFMARARLTTGLRGITTLPASCWALESSSGVESPFLGFLALMGNRIILDLYSFSLWAFSCRDSTLLSLRRCPC